MLFSRESFYRERLLYEPLFLVETFVQVSQTLLKELTISSLRVTVNETMYELCVIPLGGTSRRLAIWCATETRQISAWYKGITEVVM